VKVKIETEFEYKNEIVGLSLKNLNIQSGRLRIPKSRLFAISGEAGSLFNLEIARPKDFPLLRS